MAGGTGPLDRADIVSGSRYLKVFDPAQVPPEQRRRINVEVTRWLNDCLGFGLTDAFCGFKAYRAAALAKFEITDDGYAMPLQVWVQAAEHGMTVVEVPVPLIYLDENRAFGGALDDASYRLNHYRTVFQDALRRSRLEVGEIEGAARAEDHGPLDLVGQFADVAEPALRLQPSGAFGRDVQSAQPVAGRNAREQLPGKRDDVGAAVA